MQDDKENMSLQDDKGNDQDPSMKMKNKGNDQNNQEEKKIYEKDDPRTVALYEVLYRFIPQEKVERINRIKGRIERANELLDAYEDVRSSLSRQSRALGDKKAIQLDAILFEEEQRGGYVEGVR